MKTTKELSLDIVYGVHAVTESLEANTGNKLYIQDDLRGKNGQSNESYDPPLDLCKGTKAENCCLVDLPPPSCATPLVSDSATTALSVIP